MKRKGKAWFKEVLELMRDRQWNNDEKGVKEDYEEDEVGESEGLVF